MKRAIPILIVFTAIALSLTAQRPAKYFPPQGEWQRKLPSELGFDSTKLKEAIVYAQANGGSWDFEKQQVRVFGAPLGPLPKTHAATNGIVLRHGYLVAEFGDIKANDPVYSVAKSFLSTLCGVAVERGLIRDVNDPVARYVHDGGYDSAHNAQITWKNHLQQTSEWEGTMWGKNSDFVGAQEFGASQQKPRAIQPPGSLFEYNDVRINRFSLSLLRLFETGLPDVLNASIMDPIGASQDWRWLPYENAYVEIHGQKIGSVSGGTRWGGGLWINSEDLARFGLLILNRGQWKNQQLVPAKWLADAVIPSEREPDYGYLWWLNTDRKAWPSAPATSFAAMGNGANTIWIDPDDDIVFVWRWFRNDAMDQTIAKILSALTNPTE
ncbi:MAG TPA: serine hydrolase [Candidatus Acidoferrales bacterium]|nr:serine hydrolase [Candidatus Acidoferrales bacterium]